MMKTVFLFSGQGSHYFQMGRELFEHDPCFRTAMQRMDELVKERCGESVLAMLYHDSGAKQQPFNRTLLSHPAIFMVEYALAQTLMEAGVEPDLLLGASLGSFAAAAIAGCIDADDALMAVIEQAIAVETHCQPGCMIAVMGEPQRYLTPDLLARCELAASNFATHSVISLPEQSASQVEAYLHQQGLNFQRLAVSFAFHSQWIDPARQSYQQFLDSLHSQQAAIPIICCASGDTLHTLSSNHFWSVARNPIRFRQTIELMETKEPYRYIDLGPGGTLATFLKYGLPTGTSSQIHMIMSPFGRDVESLKSVVTHLGKTPHILSSKNALAQTKHSEHGAEKEHIMETHKMKAIIFPGQGAQFKGMGKDVFPLYPELEQSASDILGYSLKELCLNDPRGQLSQTQYTQPALFAVSAMHYYQQLESDAAKQSASRPDFFAGHSLGEYNALLAAGAFSFETGLRLVKKRGELMGAISGGAMAAVLGVSAKEVQAMLDEHKLDQIDIANFNSPTQTVIAGSKAALAAAEQVFSTRGVRCVVLNVSAAFHSRHMQSVQLEFAQFLQQFTFAKPATPVIANATARPYDYTRIAETLAKQISSPVKWVDSIRYLMGQERGQERGQDQGQYQGQDKIEFQEIGANVLSKMVREIQATETPIIVSIDDVPPAKSVNEMSVGEDAAPPDAKATHASDIAPATALLQVRATSLGSAIFRQRYGLQYAYMAGAMYRGVASAELVIRMGQANFLSFFGAGGLSLARIEANIVRIQGELRAGQPYGMNLLANYEYPAQENAVVELYLKHGIKNVEAAAFMQMTPALVRFRLQGLRVDAKGGIVCEHRVVAKISRPEVARAFMSPPPSAIVDKLLAAGQITRQQAELSQKIPVSHDICVEADSGGHTDGGISAVMLPPLLLMRDEMQRTYGYAEPICMGLAGGIGGPEAAAAAFLLGADFVMTGSINQCTVEAGMSDDGKAMLQEIDIQDTEYAPAGDMFEIGAQVQVLKKSVFFPSRANKLHSLYRHYSSLDEIPERTRNQIETTFFKKSFDDVWFETKEYLRVQNLEHEIVKAEANPKHKMALVFRWYFAYCTRIAMEGKGEDRVNYQIQTGPALGSFNQWVKGTELEPWHKRHVDRIAVKLMDATADHMARSFSRFMVH
jgi:trans-AT polyketide synthase/acyltransferase/oxidoreductase domain-containing protein